MDEEYLWLVNGESIYEEVKLSPTVSGSEYTYDCLCYALFLLVFSPHGANDFFFCFFFKFCYCLAIT